MKLFLINVALALSVLASCGQTSSIGGACEGCEAIYESPVAFDELPFADSLPGFFETGAKLLIAGRVLTEKNQPLPNVVLYVYHTNTTGVYPTSGNDTGWVKRHGTLRGWLKTNEKGEYKFFTIRPGAYPGGDNPAHIHITIKEKGKQEYWVDEFHFEDDAALTEDVRKQFEERGGSGIIRVKKIDGILTGSRDIIAGKNIPGYQ